ncbi:hypothetical protein OPT61_g520 [Boeremia exigua]|uniref:Uncharacterized protein n=1 Tax=Boeremia exigua TaxID=749465 RepID=A0ACC2ITL1_9PLEO|nr:hypothetical protein OPT61_g520 [Boeremia exigua]
MSTFFREESLAINLTQQCGTLINVDSPPVFKTLSPSCEAIASRLTRRRPAEASCEPTTPRLGFLPLAEWDEYNSYNEDTPSRIRYTIEWKLAVNNKVVSRDTEQDVILAPAVYWRMYLQAKVKQLVDKKLSPSRQVEYDDTSVVASVNDRSERDLCKRYDNMHIDWPVVGKQLLQWAELFRSGKRLRVNLSFNYIESSSATSATASRGQGRGSSATQRMLADRATQLDAEQSSGASSVWREVYALMRCPGPSCNLGPHCWRDPFSKKHYRLQTHHLKALVELVQHGYVLSSHDDVPEDVRSQLYAEKQQRQERRSTAAAAATPGLPPITITNVMPSPSHRSLSTTSASATLTSEKPRPASVSLDIPGPRDVAVVAYSEWQRSNVVNKAQRVEYQKACDATLEDMLDLEQSCADQRTMRVDSARVESARVEVGVSQVSGSDYHGAFVPALGIYNTGRAPSTGRSITRSTARALPVSQERIKVRRVRASANRSPAAARSETAPQPLIVIPFARDGDFVERGTIVDDLQKRCAASDSWTALVGLGGVGKSQLAIEHAYRTRDASAETWVLWVYASNAARYEQSLRDIADAVKLAGRQDPQANIFKLVHDWLRACKHRWLLVLDNVDDAHFLVDRPAASSTASSKPLREYLPHCERGSILVTTRNKEAALKLVEQCDIVEVGPMGAATAITLLEKKLGAENSGLSDRSDLAKLAAALEYMPLAIVQAAAYIVQRAARYSVAKYLDDYRRSERKRTSLLEYDNGQLRRDWEAKNSIIVTWQISFEHIRETWRSAAELLSLMSLFDRQGIPEDVLRWRGKQESTESDHPGPETEDADSVTEDEEDDDDDDEASQSSTSDESEEDTFEDDVVVLRNFCFIADETSRSSFEMHALVQLATRRWLATNNELERWRQQFIHNLSAAFPTGAYENWAVCGPLFAHAKAAAEQRPRDERALTQWATLLYRAAWYAVQRGNAAEAEQLAVASLKTRQKVLGQEHEDTWWGMSMVAGAYSLGGEWGKAELLQQQVMESRKTKLGADHPSTLTSMANLASTYRNQGQWKDAEELEVEVIETRG